MDLIGHLYDITFGTVTVRSSFCGIVITKAVSGRSPLPVSWLLACDLRTINCLPCLYEASRRNYNGIKPALNQRIVDLEREARTLITPPPIPPRPPESEPRVHLICAAKSEDGFARPWCPIVPSLDVPFCQDALLATCLECLNLALDHAVRNNDSETASALMNRRKELPNSAERRKATREAERKATPSPQAYYSFAKHSHGEMRQHALEQGGFHSSRLLLAADVLHLLDEVERLAIDLAAEKIDRGYVSYKQAYDELMERMRGV